MSINKHYTILHHCRATLASSFCGLRRGALPPAGPPSLYVAHKIEAQKSPQLSRLNIDCYIFIETYLLSLSSSSSLSLALPRPQLLNVDIISCPSPCLSARRLAEIRDSETNGNLYFYFLYILQAITILSVTIKQFQKWQFFK